ncbi:unnamed protein product [Arabidopsis lyrata]|uniref:Predicted protein n=2 Tax=Arabidopsis TaxID=3701 RepID=D7KC04_ARALL|nr:predicted protein [Arabidopsis lyrata subsp. lyrata]KAG7599760.1 Pectinesterase catalytic [Arabidopsis suecica]CAH8254862.1 unnamed protein product [Arabidopsis lyrata]
MTWNFIFEPCAMASTRSGRIRSTKTRKEAINATSRSGRFVIYVKQGIYYEYLEIQNTNVMLRGDGKGKTIITGRRSFVGGTTTSARPGANNRQAVALKSMWIDLFSINAVLKAHLCFTPTANFTAMASRIADEYRLQF